MHRTLRLTAVVLLVALATMPLLPTQPVTIPAGPAGSAAISTAPSHVPAGGGWVVESAGYSGPRGAGTTFVTCIPQPDLATPYELRTVWRQIEVPPLVSYDADEGQPCPAGRLLEEIR